MAKRLIVRATTKKRYSDTAIREPEPGTGTGTAHNLCKLSHLIPAGDRSNNIFQGGRGKGGGESFLSNSLRFP